MIEQTSDTSKGFWRDESATNFHTTVLAQLLNSYHRTSLPKLKHFGNADKDLLCFPWAIVEVKPSTETRAEFCYCQAANASSYALQLFEDLVHQATGHRDYNMPLVVALTFVGPEYKVWIAFTSPSETGNNCHVSVIPTSYDTQANFHQHTEDEMYLEAFNRNVLGYNCSEANSREHACLGIPNTSTKSIRIHQPLPKGASPWKHTSSFHCSNWEKE